MDSLTILLCLSGLNMNANISFCCFPIERRVVTNTHLMNQWLTMANMNENDMSMEKRKKKKWKRKKLIQSFNSHKSEWEREPAKLTSLHNNPPKTNRSNDQLECSPTYKNVIVIFFLQIAFEGTEIKRKKNGTCLLKIKSEKTNWTILLESIDYIYWDIAVIFMLANNQILNETNTK